MAGSDDKELEELLQAAIDGDQKAYDGFLRQTARLVRGYARRRTGDGGVDPEDVVQEVLLAIHLKRHTWREGSAVKPWLFAIARHKLIDAYRRKGRRIELPIDDFSEQLAEQEEETATDWEIDRALAALAPGQRSVVDAVSVRGQSISEAATNLGMNETAVRVALHRGLKTIARKFGQA